MSETTSPLSLVAGGGARGGRAGGGARRRPARGSSATAPTAARPARAGCSGSPAFEPLRRGTALDGGSTRAAARWSVVPAARRAPSWATSGRLRVLRDRAVVATEMSFTITDPRRTDDPLVWVNPSFTRLTGYPLRRGRRPQLPAPAGRRNTDPRGDPPDQRGPAPREPITEVLLNYRRDGTAFWNQVSISPVFDGDGRAGQLRRRPERRHRARDGRAGARARRWPRPRRPARSCGCSPRRPPQMTGGARRRRRLHPARRASPCRSWPTCARWTCSTGPARARRAGSPSPARDPADEAQLHGWRTPRRYRVGPGRHRPGARRRRSALVPELPERGADRYPDDPAAAAVFDRLRLRSAMVVPLRARGRVLGALTLLTQHPYGRRYGPRDLHLAADLAGPGGPGRRQRPALRGRARRGDRRCSAACCRPCRRSRACRSPPATWSASTATRSAATGTTCCRCPTARSASRSATSSATTCGRRPRWASCAASLRSYAWDGGPPGSVLDRCDQLVQGLEMAAMATAVYARLEPPAADGVRVLRYANAGHPRPADAHPAGELVRLDGTTRR